jgi:hypothetical protein
MLKGEAELKMAPEGSLAGKGGQCFDIAVLKDQIGTHGALFRTEAFCTRGCYWITRLLTSSQHAYGQ